MRAEMETIRARVERIHKEFVVELQGEILMTKSISVPTKIVGNAIIEELNIYKIRLESILSETDIKKQDHLY